MAYRNGNLHSAALASTMCLLALTTLGCGDDSESDTLSGGTDSSAATTTAATTTGSTSESATTSDSASNTSVGSTATESVTTDASTTVVETDSATTTGGNICASVPNHMCSAPVECGDECGAQGSIFDELGCVRPACATHEECGDASLCYHPDDYGGCASSDVSCNEGADGICECGSDDDCGGSYCVPAEIFFGGATDGPADGWIDRTCAPDDGPAFVLMLGLDDNSCTAENVGDPALRIIIAQAPGQPGTYTLEAADNSAQYAAGGDLTNAEIAVGGVIRVFSWDDTVAGEYEIGLADTSVLAGSFAVPFCNSDVTCG